MLLISGDMNALESATMTTAEPQFNKVPRDCQNVLAVKRIRHIQVLFHILRTLLGDFLGTTLKF